MKKLILVLTISFVILSIHSCNEPVQQQVVSNDNNQQQEIDSLKNLISAMKPGLGEFMLGVQTHHAKLYFAGKNSNWELAQFEMDEIHELLESAQKIETDRPEIKSLPMIFPALDSLSKDIAQKNEKNFETDFATLTNTCNSCHTKVNFGFNVVTIPTEPPVSNQDFRAPSEK
jgi:hypothetical protein